MREICGVLLSHNPPVPHDEAAECLRPNHHDGPRVVCCGDTWFLWETTRCDNPREDCCLSDDVDDHCISYQAVLPDVAAEYLADPLLVGEEWKR